VKSQTPTEILHIRIPSSLACRIRREAEKQGRSVTKTAEMLFVDALDRIREAEEREADQVEARKARIRAALHG